MTQPEQTPTARGEAHRRVAIDDLLRYRFLSSLEVSPSEHWAAFTVKQADRDDNDYSSNLYVADLHSGTSNRVPSTFE